MRRFVVVAITGVLFALLWVGIAAAKGPITPLKVIIAGDSIPTPVEVAPSEMGAFQKAWEESWKSVEAPERVSQGLVAILHLWLGGDLNREKPDLTVEYYRFAGVGYFYYPVQQSERGDSVATAFWTGSSLAMDDFLARYLGTLPSGPPLNPAPASASSWVWLSVSLAAALAALFIVTRFLLKRRRAIIIREESAH